MNFVEMNVNYPIQGWLLCSKVSTKVKSTKTHIKCCSSSHKRAKTTPIFKIQYVKIYIATAYCWHANNHIDLPK